MSEMAGGEERLIWVPNVRTPNAPTAEEIAAGTELLTPADIDRYALGGGDEIDRIIDTLWCRAADLHSSADFRDEDGEIPEATYVAVKAEAIKQAKRDIERQLKQ